MNVLDVEIGSGFYFSPICLFLKPCNLDRGMRFREWGTSFIRLDRKKMSLSTHYTLCMTQLLQPGNSQSHGRNEEWGDTPDSTGDPTRVADMAWERQEDRSKIWAHFTPGSSCRDCPRHLLRFCPNLCCLTPEYADTKGLRISPAVPLPAHADSLSFWRRLLAGRGHHLTLTSASDAPVLGQAANSEVPASTFATHLLG